MLFRIANVCLDWVCFKNSNAIPRTELFQGIQTYLKLHTEISWNWSELARDDLVERKDGVILALTTVVVNTNISELHSIKNETTNHV